MTDLSGCLRKIDSFREAPGRRDAKPYPGGKKALSEKDLLEALDPFTYSIGNLCLL